MNNDTRAALLRQIYSMLSTIQCADKHFTLPLDFDFTLQQAQGSVMAAVRIIEEIEDHQGRLPFMTHSRIEAHQ